MQKMFLSKGWMTTAPSSKKYRIAVGVAVFAMVVAGIGWSLKPVVYTPEPMIGTPLSLEIADTPDTQAQGLSGREEVPEGYGMLFVFDRKDRHGFWMKDMLVPIDIFWLTDTGYILGIEKQVQPATYPTIFYPEKPVRYVLETRAGHADALSLSIGDRMPGIQLPLSGE